jgi:hypothetical protein
VQIPYEVLNEREDVLAERTYTVWPDLEQLPQAAAGRRLRRDGRCLRLPVAGAGATTTVLPFLLLFLCRDLRSLVAATA